MVFLLVISTALCFMWRNRRVKPVAPPKTGISGQLQKAFVTGAPKLNRPELETATEDFSNIIATFDAFTIYKGILSSRVEIAVASTRITSSLDWSAEEELAYRKKVKEVEHLDWNVRVRVIQYMHHGLSPPVPHSKLSSTMVFLTDDYAAKVAESAFDILPKSKDSGEDGPLTGAAYSADQRENVYDFGILLLEIITGTLPYSEGEGSLIDWASQYLNDQAKYKDMIDPILKSVKTNELEMICDVIQQCIESDPLRGPTIQAVTSRLREAIPLTPEDAVQRLSPLWWAELELLSVEAT